MKSKGIKAININKVNPPTSGQARLRNAPESTDKPILVALFKVGK